MQKIKIKDLGTEPLDDATLVSSMSMLTAIQVHKSGNVGKAASIYANVLKHNAESSDAACLLGVAAYDSGIYDEAENFMRKATQLDPMNPDYQLQIGRVYNKQGKKDLALEAFSKSIVASPRPDAFVDMGNMAFAEGNFTQAENCYKQAISMAPDEHSYYYKLANFYEKRKQMDLAIETWGIALTYASDDNYQRFMLVRLCLQNNYNRQALEHISVLIQNKDDLTPQVQLLLAPICHNLEDYEGAAILWQAVINRTPQRSDLYLKVADSYQKIKKYDSAVIAYRLYLDEYDYAPEVYRKISQPLFKLGHRNEAFECMRIAIVQSNHHAEFFITLATMYQEIKDYNQSLTTLYEGQKYNPDNKKIQALITFFKQLIAKKQSEDNKEKSAPKMQARPMAQPENQLSAPPQEKEKSQGRSGKMKQSSKADIYDLLLSQVNKSSKEVEKPKARSKPKNKPKGQMTKKQMAQRKLAQQQSAKRSNKPKTLSNDQSTADSKLLEQLNNLEKRLPSANSPSTSKTKKGSQKVKTQPAKNLRRPAPVAEKKAKVFKTSGKKDNGLSLDILKDIIQEKQAPEKKAEYQNFTLSQQNNPRERLTPNLSNKKKSSKSQQQTPPRKLVNDAYDHDHNNPQGFNTEDT